MVVDISQAAKGVVMLFIGAFVIFTVANSLFGTTNTAAVAVNATMNTAGKTDQGTLLITAWDLLLTGVGIGVLALGVKYLVSSFQGV